MICFKCGKQGHKEDTCGVTEPAAPAPNSLESRKAPQDEVQERDFGSWMLVKRPSRRTQGRNQQSGSRIRGPAPVEPEPARVGHASTRSAATSALVPELEGNLFPPQQDTSSGSRFRALENLDLNMATEDQDTGFDGAANMAVEDQDAGNGVDADMREAPHPESGVQASLERTDRTIFRAPVADNYGMNPCGDEASTLAGTHNAAPLNEAQDSNRPITTMPRNANINSPRAQQEHRAQINHSPLGEAPGLELVRNRAGPARISRETRPRTANMTTIPTGLCPPHPDRGREVIQAGPSRSFQRSSSERAVPGLRNQIMTQEH